MYHDLFRGSLNLWRSDRRTNACSVGSFALDAVDRFYRIPELTAGTLPVERASFESAVSAHVARFFLEETCREFLEEYEILLRFTFRAG